MCAWDWNTSSGKAERKRKAGEPFESQTMSVSRVLSSVLLTEKAKNKRSKLGKV